jgi:hypothetical protein
MLLNELLGCAEGARISDAGNALKAKAMLHEELDLFPLGDIRLRRRLELAIQSYGHPSTLRALTP